ncbi:hypothetical protein HOD29_02050 [archaeon]|jgi:hypothetical protein|nr:hypothetical protein [archaeon]
MKFLDKHELKEFLIDLYERYLRGEKVNETAKKIFLDYAGAGNFLEKNVYDAILTLESIGWGLETSKIEIENILQELKKL